MHARHSEFVLVMRASFSEWNNVKKKLEKEGGKGGSGRVTYYQELETNPTLRSEKIIERIKPFFHVLHIRTIFFRL